MWMELNIVFMLKALLPPLLYTLFLFLSAPYKTLTLYNSLLFFIGGILSINFVHMYYAMIDVKTFSPFYEYFFSVGPREEICKFLAFMGISKILSKEKMHPVATMFYMGIVGLGFAMFENIYYASQYGENILLGRAVTSTIGHLTFSMFLGYWLGLSQIDQEGYGNRSLFGFYMFKYKKLRKFIYVLIGLICAITFHGLWNFNLSNRSDSSTTIMILMMVLGLITCKFASTDLYNHHKKSLKG